MKKINFLIRLFLYIAVFWIPYSPAVIESCVVTGFLLYAVKRCIVSYQLGAKYKFSDRVKIAFIPKKTFLDKNIAVFLFACFLSVAGSLFLAQSLRGFITKTLEWFIIFYLIQESFTEKKHFKIALGIFIFTTFSTVLDSFYQFYISSKDIFNGRELLANRATAGFHHANSLAGYLTLAIPFVGSFVADRKIRPLFRIFAGILTVLFLWSLTITFSRAAFIAVLLGILVFIFYYNKKAAMVLISLTTVFSVVYFGSIAQKLDSSSRFSMDRMSSMALWRAHVWEDTYKMIKEKPLTGHGINSYMKLFQDYRRKKDGKFFYGPTYAHNCYIQMIAEIGLIGIISFMFMIYNFFAGIITRSGKNIAAIGLLSGIFAFFVHSFFDTDLYSLQLVAYLWFTIGFMVSYSAIDTHGSSI